MVNVADILVLDSFVDWTERSCAEETLFEELGGGGEVARVLLVTQVTGLLRRIFGGKGSGVDLGSEWSVSVAVDDCGYSGTGCACLFDNN